MNGSRTLARERGVVKGRRTRVDTTVVETNIHYPTDGGLFWETGPECSTRTMNKDREESRWSAGKRFATGCAV